MKKFELANLFNIENNFSKYKDDIFECFIEFYGEEHREYILNKLNDVNIHYQKLEINSNVKHYNFVINLLNELLESDKLLEFNNKLNLNNYKSWNVKDVLNNLSVYNHKLEKEKNKIKLIKKYYDHILKNNSNYNEDIQLEKIMSLFILDDDFMNMLNIVGDGEISEDDLIHQLNYYFSDTAYNNTGLITFGKERADIFLPLSSGINIEETLIHELNHVFVDGVDHLDEGIIEIINEAISQKILNIMHNKGISLVMIDISSDFNLYKDSIHLVNKIINNLPGELLLDFKYMIDKEYNENQLFSNCKNILGTNIMNDIIKVLKMEINVINAYGSNSFNSSKLDSLEEEILAYKQEIDNRINNILGDNNEKNNNKRNI